MLQNQNIVYRLEIIRCYKCYKCYKFFGNLKWKKVPQGNWTLKIIPRGTSKALKFFRQVRFLPDFDPIVRRHPVGHQIMRRFSQNSPTPSFSFSRRKSYWLNAHTATFQKVATDNHIRIRGLIFSRSPKKFRNTWRHDHSRPHQARPSLLVVTRLVIETGGSVTQSTKSCHSRESRIVVGSARVSRSPSRVAIEKSFLWEYDKPDTVSHVCVVPLV